MSRAPLHNPVIVCTTKQIDELKNDPKFKEIPWQISPVFQPNDAQVEKIKAILVDADAYMLTKDGFQLVE